MYKNPSIPPKMLLLKPQEKLHFQLLLEGNFRDHQSGIKQLCGRISHPCMAFMCKILREVMTA